MNRFVYFSEATRSLSKADLLELLTQSRERNRHLKLTGMLLYGSGMFLQVLEGAQHSVQAVYASIAADERNTANQVLLDIPVETREFPDWAMGFDYARNDELIGIPGYSDFMSGGGSDAEFDSAVMDLLYAFRDRANGHRPAERKYTPASG